MRALRSHATVAGRFGTGVVRITAAEVGLALLCVGFSYAANAQMSGRFALTASAEVSAAPARHTGVGFQIDATLDRSAPASVPSDAEISTFTLVAKLANAPFSCPDDTIFENGFEG